MGWLEVLDSASGVGQGVADLALDVGHAVPLAGEAISASQAFYHTGSAVYDGVTGDRDGAISHGTEAVVHGLSAIPGISEVAGVADTMIGVPALGARIGMQAGGQDADAMPDSLAAVLSQSAVGATRAIFGEDDSNWIAEGDTPTGTRRGEIMAGTTAMQGLPMLAAGPAGIPLALLHGAGGAAVGNTAADLLADDPDGPTSGVSESAGLAGDLTQWQFEKEMEIAREVADGVVETGRGLGRGARNLAGRAVQAGRNLAGTGEASPVANPTPRLPDAVEELGRPG